MKLKKSMLALVAATTMGVAMVGAAAPAEVTVGVVNINAVAEAMPAFPAYAKQAEAIGAKYAPQLATAEKEMKAATTDAARAAVEKKYLPVVEAMQKEDAAAGATLRQQIETALQNLMKKNQYQGLIPLNLPPNAKIVDATQAVIASK